MTSGRPIHRDLDLKQANQFQDMEGFQEAASSQEEEMDYEEWWENEEKNKDMDHEWQK